MKRLNLAILLALAIGCGGVPAPLGPQASVAWRNTRVIKALDLVRDVAVDANAQVPPLVSTEVTRKIVTWHRASLQLIQVSDTGWRPTVAASLEELQKQLPADDRVRLAPYLALAKTLILEVN